MTLRKFAALAALCVSACTTVPAPRTAQPIEVQILALNDFHGNLDPSDQPVRFQLGSDQFASARLGGAAFMGAALTKVR